MKRSLINYVKKSKADKIFYFFFTLSLVGKAVMVKYV